MFSKPTTIASTIGRQLLLVHRRYKSTPTKSTSTFKLPAPTWSLKDLKLTADEPISEEELERLAKRSLIDLDYVEDKDELRQDLANMMACLEQVHAIDLPELSDEEMYDAPRGLEGGAPVRKGIATPEEEKEAKEVWDELLSKKVTKVGSHNYFSVVTGKNK